MIQVEQVGRVAVPRNKASWLEHAFRAYILFEIEKNRKGERYDRKEYHDLKKIWMEKALIGRFYERYLIEKQEETTQCVARFIEERPKVVGTQVKTPNMVEKATDKHNLAHTVAQQFVTAEEEGGDRKRKRGFEGGGGANMVTG